MKFAVAKGSINKIKNKTDKKTEGTLKMKNCHIHTWTFSKALMLYCTCLPFLPEWFGNVRNLVERTEGERRESTERTKAGNFVRTVSLSMLDLKVERYK